MRDALLAVLRFMRLSITDLGLQARLDTEITRVRYLVNGELLNDNTRQLLMDCRAHMVKHNLITEGVDTILAVDAEKIAEFRSLGWA